MRLGIPGSTAMLWPEQRSASQADNWDDTMNAAAASGVAGTTLATVQMLQHLPHS